MQSPFIFQPRLGDIVVVVFAVAQQVRGVIRCWRYTRLVFCRGRKLASRVKAGRSADQLAELEIVPGS